MKKYKALKYSNYIIRIILICCLFTIVPLVYIFTKNANEQFNLFYLVFPFILALCFVLIMRISRKVTLGNLMAFEIDMNLVYELDKRKDNLKNKIYNLQLLSNVKFYDGIFEEVILCSDEILKLSNDYDEIFMARHYKILSLFLCERFTEISKLIELQFEDSRFVNKIPIDDSKLYYGFIKYYLASQYNEAIEVILKMFDVKNIQILNNKKVLVYYLIRKASVQIDDFELLQKCNKEIFKADINRSTFFSKTIIKES